MAAETEEFEAQPPGLEVEEGEEGKGEKREKRPRREKGERRERPKKKPRAIDIDCVTSNSKTELNAFAQIALGRCVTKADIVYETKRDGDLWSSELTLPTLPGGSFSVTSEGTTSKEAEKNAAQAALFAHREEIDVMNEGSEPILTKEEMEEKLKKSSETGNAAQD